MSHYFKIGFLLINLTYVRINDLKCAKRPIFMYLNFDQSKCKFWKIFKKKPAFGLKLEEIDIGPIRSRVYE